MILLNSIKCSEKFSDAQDADTSDIVACQRPQVGRCLRVDVNFEAFSEDSLALMDVRTVVFNKGRGTRFGRTVAFEYMVRVDVT